MDIARQGAVRVNDCVVVYQNEDVACLELDLHSKYIDIPIVGLHAEKEVFYPVLYLNATEHTLHLDETKSQDSTTELQFTEFSGWDVFCCDGPYRYTVRLVLMKRPVHG